MGNARAQFETPLQASIAYARMKLRDAWEAHQCGPVVPCGEAFERAHEAQTAILDAIEVLAAELHGGGHG